MAVGALTEEVATNLEEVAEVTRQIDTRVLTFFTGGIGVGIALGFFWGYRYNREKIRVEAFRESEIEVEKIRKHYQQKLIVAEPKPKIGEVVDSLGYRSQESERPLPAPVPIIETPSVKESVTAALSVKDKNTGWSYPTELASRKPDKPYIIHQDEYFSNELDYAQTSYIYWTGDHVLTDVDHVPIVDAIKIIGHDTLRWGHGADDDDVVYIRNDVLELELEICRDSRSWEETVQGLDNSDPENELSHSAQSRPASKQKRNRRQ